MWRKCIGQKSVLRNRLSWRAWNWRIWNKSEKLIFREALNEVHNLEWFRRNWPTRDHGAQLSPRRADRSVPATWLTFQIEVYPSLAVQTPHSKLFRLTKIPKKSTQREPTITPNQRRISDRIRAKHLTKKATLINCIQMMDSYHRARIGRASNRLAGKLTWASLPGRIGVSLDRGLTVVRLAMKAWSLHPRKLITLQKWDRIDLKMKAKASSA